MCEAIYRIARENLKEEFEQTEMRSRENGIEIGKAQMLISLVKRWFD